jgi:response regulator receiver domain-containing protein
MMQEILVVDDDRQNLGLVRHLLENEQMTVQCATSGEEALRKLEKNTFDLMITDLNMPGLDGFELARKAAVIAPHMPIVVYRRHVAGCPVRGHRSRDNSGPCKTFSPKCNAGGNQGGGRRAERKDRVSLSVTIYLH